MIYCNLMNTLYPHTIKHLPREKKKRRRRKDIFHTVYIFYKINCLDNLRVVKLIGTCLQSHVHYSVVLSYMQLWKNNYPFFFCSLKECNSPFCLFHSISLVLVFPLMPSLRMNSRSS